MHSIWDPECCHVLESEKVTRLTEVPAFQDLNPTLK